MRYVYYSYVQDLISFLDTENAVYEIYCNQHAHVYVHVYMYMYVYSTKNEYTITDSHREGEAMESAVHVNDDMGREISAGLSPSELQLNMIIS